MQKNFPDINYLKAKLSAAAEGFKHVSEKKAAEMKRENTERWICSMMSVSGSSLQPESIHKMAEGECALEATIEESRLFDACLRYPQGL